MQLHHLTAHPARTSKKRIGRGGKRGKTSGRGHKGQLARAGNSTRPEMREEIKKLPKLRGHGVNRAKTVHSGRVRPVVINVATLEKNFAAGDTVSPKTLVGKGVINGSPKRNVPAVKLLGQGEITKQLSVENCQVSQSAKTKIEAAGGSVK